MFPTLLGYVNEFEDNNLQNNLGVKYLKKGGDIGLLIPLMHSQCFIISFSYSLSL